MTRTPMRSLFSWRPPSFVVLDRLLVASGNDRRDEPAHGPGGCHLPGGQALHAASAGFLRRIPPSASRTRKRSVQVWVLVNSRVGLTAARASWTCIFIHPTKCSLSSPDPEDLGSFLRAFKEAIYAGCRIRPSQNSPFHALR